MTSLIWVERKLSKMYAEDMAEVGCFTLLVLAFVAFFTLLLFTRIEWSEDNVAGIVYSTTNNAAISGNTNFKVRASVDTYINEDKSNESAYCLPPNSQYKELVNKAAADKAIKVNVTTKKGFWVKLPWTCIDNVTVAEVK